MSDVTLTIDGRTVVVPAGTLVVEAARRVGISIPVYCYYPKLKPAGACRMCLVSIERFPKLQTACTTPVAEGMAVHTGTTAATDGRRDVLELLLINHPLDCPICDKGGECDLQDFTMLHGPGQTRFDRRDKIHRLKHVPVPPFLVLDQERCILCQRCTRYEEEITGERNIVLEERGDEMIVAPREAGDYPGWFAGNNTEICPVGAWTSAPYRFKARPWDLDRRETVCTHCSLGCNVRADLRHGVIERQMIHENPEVDGGWLCDRGRYGFAYTRADERLREPRLRQGGELIPVSWERALGEMARQIQGARRAGALGGGRLSCQEALFLHKLWRRVVGSNNLDWRTGAQAVAAPEALGLTPARPADVDRADLVVLLDVRPSEQAPVLDLRVRRAPRVLGTGPLPNWEDPAPLTGGGSFEHWTVEPGELPGEVVAAVRAADRPVVLWSGAPESADAVRTLAAPTLIVGEQPNGRGAEAAGLLPDLLPGYRPLGDPDLPGMPATPGADPRACDVLYVVGARLGERPATAGFVVVQDLFPTPAAQWADLVLPAAGSFEKDGTYLNLAGAAQRAARLVPPPGNALPDGEIFRRLARALGQDIELSAADLASLEPVWRAAPALTAPEPAARARRLFDGDGTVRFDPHLRIVRERTAGGVRA